MWDAVGGIGVGVVALVALAACLILAQGFGVVLVWAVTVGVVWCDLATVPPLRGPARTRRAEEKVGPLRSG